MHFVLIQFSLLGFLFYNIEWGNLNLISISLFSLAIIIGIISILYMGVKNLSISPAVKTNARFIAKGPYKIVRHPMYTALVVFAFAAIVTSPSWHQILAVFLLLVVLILKLRVEERGLEKVFPEYVNYKNNTYRLIPFLY